MKRITSRAFYWKGLSIIEDLMDRLLTGCRLTTDVLNMPASTGTQPTHYLIIRHIFSKMIVVSDDDAVIDVGCGQGRVLAYLQHRVLGAKLAGVDFNRASIDVAKQWTEKKGIHLYCEDARSLDYNPYTVLYLFRPFPADVFQQFVDHLEATLKHPIKMIYLSDQESYHFLRSRDRWTQLQREVIFKLHGLQVAGSPQGCSVWTFTPFEVSPQ